MTAVDDDHVDDPYDMSSLHQRAVARAERALERARSRRPNEQLPRIEQVRARFAATITLLTDVATQLEDLRELATDRAVAAERLAVQGGTRDYALDTNGDPKARKLYRQVVWEMLDMLEDSAEASHGILKFFKTGTVNNGRRLKDADATPEEFDAALEAQARRHQRGELSHAPLVAQPTVRRQTREQLRQEIIDLRTAVAKVHPQRLTKDAKRRLTSGELAAWERAVPKPTRAPRGVLERPTGGWRRW